MPTHYFTRMANYWLLKSEPNVYSIADLQRDGSTCWEGVRNYSARNNMRRMTVGDLALFYHSNANPPGVVGVCRIKKEAYPEIKSTRSFEDMVLVRHGRLSVQPVKKSEFDAIVRMGRRK